MTTPCRRGAGRPCFAHLLDEPHRLTNQVLANLL